MTYLFSLDDLNDAVELLVGELLGADVGADFGLLEDELGAGRADALDIRKRGFDALVAGDVDTKKTGHGESKLVSGSTLALLQARIFLLMMLNTALPADDLAVRSAAFDGKRELS